MTRHPITLALAVLATTLAACSSVPDRHAGLENARARLASVQNDRAVATQAADELRVAGEAFARADSAQRAEADRAEVDHLVYLAGQRLVMAQETAASRTAQAVTDGAGAERERQRLALRTAEADAAQRALSASQAAGVRKDAALASSATQIEGLEARLQEQLRAMDARRTANGVVITLGDMLFDTGRSELRAEGAGNVARLAEFMRQYPQRRALVEGFTDDVGSDALNQQLSERRARSVTTALVGLGVDPARLETRGLGESNPAAGNDTAAGRQMNRRVEIVLAVDADGRPLR